MSDFSIFPGGKIVKDVGLVEVYYQQPVPIANFTRVDAVLNPTITSGTVLVATFPHGIDLFNGALGVVTDYNTATSGNSRFTSVIESNLRRAGLPISGAIVAGRR